MNKKSKTSQFIVIGGGLAGSFLSLRLLDAGQSVILIDNQDKRAASRVAAGLFNPITGRFGAKSWMADILFPSLHAFFQEERNHGLLHTIHHMPIYRPFKEVKEYNKWTGRAHDPEFKDWVIFQEQERFPEALENTMGGLEIQHCGWTETGKMLTALQQMMQEQEHFRLIPVTLPHQSIDLTQKHIRWEEERIQFDHLVLCTGYQMKEYPIWPEIPIIPNKGELLTIEAPDLKLDFIFSRKVYLIPLADQQFIVGSTYKNEFEHIHPSESGKAEICFHLEKAIKVPYRICDQRAGIRPTTPDRKPILGTHPELDYVHTFTGLGTKGVTQAPYFSQIMTDYLLHHQSLLPAIDVKRFL